VAVRGFQSPGKDPPIAPHGRQKKRRGVCSNPQHIVEYTDGEIRRQCEVIYISWPNSGDSRIYNEADGVCWIAPGNLTN
jgi:hypothetical protein